MCPKFGQPVQSSDINTCQVKILNWSRSNEWIFLYKFVPGGTLINEAGQDISINLICRDNFLRFVSNWDI